jgi:hypothetical protein
LDLQAKCFLCCVPKTSNISMSINVFH